jgi:hypothetical protein
MYPYMNTSMLRERFVIQDKSAKKQDAEPVIAMGNRIVINLKSVDGRLTEHMVIRGHNMHSVARTAARVFLDFDKKGPILSRVPEYDWDGLWESVCSKYEQDHNPQNWVAVYFKGRKIFTRGENHAFLDVMEQCDASNRDEYDHAVTIAEDIFARAGKEVAISKDTNIAAVINVTDEKSRCGLILRGAQKSSTFSIALEAKNKNTTVKPGPHICLNLSAAYLEAIQLAFRSGQLAAEVSVYEYTKSSPKSLFLQETNRRIGRLNAEIKSYEHRFNTRYRPENPDVIGISEETRRMFIEIYAEQKRQEEEQAAIEAGEDIPMID